MTTSWKLDIELIEAWLLKLDQSSYEQVIAALELLAGNWLRWYRKSIPIADGLLDTHSSTLKGRD